MAGLWTPGATTPAVTPADSTADSEKNTEFQENEKILSQDLLSPDQITDLLSEADMDGIQEKMKVFLNFKNLRTCLRDAILLDYYVSGFFWAKTMDFSINQHSKFMTLLDLLLHNLQRDSIKWLGEVMAEIGPNHSQKNQELHVFDVKEANAIIDYLKTSLFQHYRLYEFMFYSTREEIVIGTEVLDQEQSPQDLQPESEAAEADSLAGFTIDDVKSALARVTDEVLLNIQKEINEKLQAQEEAFNTRIEKLKKA
ncbi:Uncharacterized protein C10orf107-like [Cricetulus griseus]|uniref:Uncharacterized protein C10orf107-like n=1 Tax=Cricetulus griseus TaxID=10029 RepID=G3HIS6_CRIGR|nr:Uncharacterized protein C10orf107-like [Cricetulus griseus]ERE92794.1 hypothetical protein H671_1g0038 [Cricetulus griseus]